MRVATRLVIELTTRLVIGFLRQKLCTNFFYIPKGI